MWAAMLNNMVVFSKRNSVFQYASFVDFGKCRHPNRLPSFLYSHQHNEHLRVPWSHHLTLPWRWTMTLISLQRFEISLPRFSKCVSLDNFLMLIFCALKKNCKRPLLGLRICKKNNPLAFGVLVAVVFIKPTHGVATVAGGGSCWLGRGGTS